jgi:hypothetical protein
MIWALFFPVNTFHRASVDGVIDAVFRTALGFEYDSHLVGFIEFENFRTQFHTGFATSTFLRVDDNAFAHVWPPLMEKGFSVQVSAQPPAKKTAGQIEKETNSSLR